MPTFSFRRTRAHRSKKADRNWLFIIRKVLESPQSWLLYPGALALAELNMMSPELLVPVVIGHCVRRTDGPVRDYGLGRSTSFSHFAASSSAELQETTRAEMACPNRCGQWNLQLLKVRLSCQDTASMPQDILVAAAYESMTNAGRLQHGLNYYICRILGHRRLFAKRNSIHFYSTILFD